MWLVIQQRQPRPDAHVWFGRRLLAAIDAVAFPGLWMLAVANAPFATRTVGVAVVATAILVAAKRLTDAMWRNQRYRFTTWRWGKPLAGLLLVGLVFRVVMLVA